MNGAIVIVDDESAILELVCLVLSEEGYEVLALGDPGMISDLPSGARPDLFLLDLMLPGTSGIEVARSLRADGYADTPMIAMSASAWLLSEARRCGLFDETLSKPFDLVELLQLVERSAA